MKTEIFKCILRTVAPVHIGCDEVYEPTGFFVDKERACLIVFDPLDFIAGLEPADKERFSSICKKGTVESILEIYKFLRNHPVQGRPVKACPDFVKHYEQVLSLSGNKIRKELNQFIIERTAFIPGDQRPYIPGSAVKGALRTAYLNMLAENGPDLRSYLRSIKPRKGSKDDRHKKLEQKLLELDHVPNREKISKDPFRLIKVSDFMPVGEVGTKIFYAINKKKKPSDKEPNGPYQILEAVMPGAVFTGEIRVEIPGGSHLEKEAVSRPISLKKLLNSLDLFFGVQKIRENGELRNIGIPTTDTGEKGTGHLIRIGRHSGAESVTIKKYRDIKIMLGRKGKTFLDHATTLWLASDFRDPRGNKSFSPYGWALLSSVTREDETRLTEKEKDFQERRVQQMREMEEKQKARDLEREKKRQQALEKKRLEEEKKKEEERLKAELEAMTPEERAIWELQNPQVDQNRVYEIFRELDEFSEEAKQKAAKLLKDIWIKEGKWKKKNCSKKQWEKVQVLKKILGEN